MSRSYNEWKTMNWRTFEGQFVTMQTIDQQHLSNVYYFCTFIRKIESTDFEDAVFDTLRERFDGNLLPWRPNPRFIQEVEFLYRHGKINNKGQIIKKVKTKTGWQEEKIGEVDLSNKRIKYIHDLYFKN